MINTKERKYIEELIGIECGIRETRLIDVRDLDAENILLNQMSRADKLRTELGLGVRWASIHANIKRTQEDAASRIVE